MSLGAEHIRSLLQSSRFLLAILGSALLLIFGLAIVYFFLAIPSRDELCRAALGTAPGTVMDYVAWAFREETGRWLALGIYAWLMPRIDVYGIDYGLTLLALSGFWFGGFALAVDALLGKAASRLDRLMLSALLFAIFWCGAPTHEGIYWLTGGMEYAVPFFFMMLALRFACALDDPGKGVAAAIGAGLSAIVAAAMHELAGMLIVGALLCHMLLLAWLRRRRAFRNALLFLLLAVIGFAVSAGAPGNWMRASKYGDGGNILLALGLTARPYAGPTAWIADIRLVTLSTALLTLPSFRNLQPAWAKVDLPLGWLVPGLSLAGIYLAYFLGCLVQGQGPGGRNLDFYYALFVTAWLATLVVAAPRIQWGRVDIGNQALLRSASVLLLAAGLLASPGASTALHDLPRAVSDWRHEKHRLLEQIAISRAAGQMDVIVTRPRHLPAILFDSGVTHDPRFWSNRCMARFHGLRSIRLAPGEPEERGSGIHLVGG